jgi:hypothetical protein
MERIQVLVAWLMFRHIPQAQEAVPHLPAVSHEVVNNIKEWWGRK